MATEMPSTSASCIQQLQQASMSATKSNGSPTILRIKRRIDEDPAESLVLTFKRWKGDESEDNQESQGKGGTDLEGTGHEAIVVSRVIRFAGTVKPNEDQSALDEQINKALMSLENTAKNEDELTPNVNARGLKRRISNPLEKPGEENLSARSASRFRLVPSKRPSLLENGSKLQDAVEAKEAIQAMYNLYDMVEDCPQKKKENKDPRQPGAITCNGLPLVKENSASSRDGAEGSNATTDVDYVYDLYVSNGIITASLDDHYISVEDLEGPVQDYREFMDGCSDEEGQNNEDEDSNDEGNWRNDYPDSDPDEHGGDDSYFGSGQAGELGSYIGRMDINDSSSGDEDEDYCSPLSTYKSYKRRVFKELDIGFSNEVVSSEDTDAEDDDG